MAYIEFPLQFKRQYSGPLDLDFVKTTVQRTAMVTNGTLDATRYAGQVVYDSDLDKVFYLATNLTTWKEFGGASSFNDLSDVPTSFPTDSANISDLATVLAAFYDKTEVDAIIDTVVSGLDWQPAVTNYSDLATTYPTPSEGWTVAVTADSTIYLYNGSQWINIGSTFDLPMASATLDGKMSKEDFVKLQGIAAGANNYVHPATHSISEVSGLQEALDDLEQAIENSADQTFESNITVALPSGYTFGRYANGATVPAAGKTAIQVITDALRVSIPAVYNAPSASISTTSNSNIEIGTVMSVVVDGTFNKNDGGDWTSLEVRRNGGVIGTYEPYTDASVQITDSPKTYSVAYTYGVGPQKNDNLGQPSGSPLPGGTVSSSSVSFVGYRRGFYGYSTSGADKDPTTSAGIRALNSSIHNPSNGSQFTINIPAGATEVIFAYPATLQNVTSVLFEEGLNADVKGAFTLTNVTVEGANGYAGITYKVYHYAPASPFGQPATYKVKI